MKLHRFLITAAIGWLVLSRLAVSPLPAQQAATFLETYRQAVDAPTPAEARAAWDGFLKAAPEGLDAMAARLFAGVAALRAGADPGEALVYFQQGNKLGSSGLATHARMASLAAKLKTYHAQHVEYPATLDELVAAGFAKPDDLNDGFGQRFDYAASPKKIAPDIPRQAFTLRCEQIKADHRTLARGLKETDGRLTAISFKSGDPAQGQAFVRVKKPDGTWGPAQRWLVGETLEDYKLWYVFDGYALAGWREFPVVVEKLD